MFTPPLLIDAARVRRHSGGDRWFVDETYVRVAGRWICLHRAVDQYGQVIDVLLADKRDLPAARRFFRNGLAGSTAPVEVGTDLAGIYLAVLDSWSPPRVTSRISTRTIGWKPTTPGSRPGCGPCGA